MPWRCVQALVASGNALVKTPATLCQLKTLTTLNLGSNKLTSVPDELGNLSALSVLNLMGNELSCLPESFGKLVGLKLLGLKSNHLQVRAWRTHGARWCKRVRSMLGAERCVCVCVSSPPGTGPPQARACVHPVFRTRHRMHGAGKAFMGLVVHALRG